MKPVSFRYLPLVGLLLSSNISQAQTDSTHNGFSQTQMTTPVDSPAARQGNASIATEAPTQNMGSVAGKLADSKGKPVSYATVTLLRADNTVVGGDLSKDDGSFSIQPTGIGTFNLHIEAIGLTPKNIPVEITAAAPDKSVGNITVNSTTNTLKEVTVTGEKALMEMSVDKKVFNVDKNITSAGGSASDVLSNVPAVSVDVDGTVSLRGKSDVTILIDGKPSTLLGTDVASALQSLPAASIESVEVITNPSAKYDAQGLSGIINIVTKKDKRFGFNGTATLGIGTLDKYNGNLALNAHKGKVNVFFNSSFRLNSNYNYTTTDRHNKVFEGGADNSFHTYDRSQRHFNGWFNTIGAGYDINKYNTITLTENINLMQFGNNGTSDYQTFEGTDETNRNILQHRVTDGKGGPVSISSSIDYKRKFKKKDEELSVDATFSTMSIHRTQNYNTEYTTGTSSVNYTEQAPGSGGNNTFNAWADYTDPLFTKNGKLGLGVKTQLYWFNSSNDPMIDSASGARQLDTVLLSRYNYTQQIHAAYINWNDQVGKFSYQAGLRAEDAVYNGTNNLFTPVHYSNSFFNFFPSAFVSYQLPHQQSIYLNYSRRTNRPNFFQLLPFKDVSNPAVVQAGNPGLDPEFINNVELSYTKATNKGDNIIVSGYYTHTENLIERIIRPITAADSAIGLGDFVGRQFSQPVNLASGTTYGLELTGHAQILPIWDATLNFNFFQNKIEVGNVSAAEAPFVSDNSGFSWFGKVNTTIRLPKGFSLQLNGNYESAKPIAQGTLHDVYWVDAAIRKNLWKNKATLVINCSDIFNSRKYTTDYHLTQYDERYYRDRETRVGTVTFTYRFGKTDIGKPGQAGGKKGKKENTDTKPTEKDREDNLKQGDDDNGGGGMGGGGNGGGQGGGKPGGGK